MPNQILILLVIAGAGVLGSIALMVCNAVMGKRNPAPETDDDFDLTEEEDGGDTDAAADVPAAAEPAFMTMDVGATPSCVIRTLSCLARLMSTADSAPTFWL